MTTSVLVVEGDGIARNYAVRLLDKRGFCSCQAGSADEALEIVSKTRPRIVLTADALPGPSGLALVRALTPLQPEVASIVLTASADPGVGASAVEAGAFGFVRKPFQETDLLTALEGALRRQASARDDLRQRHELEASLTKSRRESVEQLARAVESRDDGTGEHRGRGDSAGEPVGRRGRCLRRPNLRPAVPFRARLGRGPGNRPPGPWPRSEGRASSRARGLSSVKGVSPVCVLRRALEALAPVRILASREGDSNVDPSVALTYRGTNAEAARFAASLAHSLRTKKPPLPFRLRVEWRADGETPVIVLACPRESLSGLGERLVPLLAERMLLDGGVGDRAPRAATALR